jgi:osmotically-inducible protein OsmY
MRPAALLAALLLVPACAPLADHERAGLDQEICRDILWAYQQDPTSRFREVRVTCVDQAVLLEGRVDTLASAKDAFQIARSKARGAAVTSRLNVQPK